MTNEDDGDLYMCVEGSAMEVDGQPVFLQPGQIARHGAKILRLAPEKFRPVEVMYEPEAPRRGSNPVAGSARADMQGARSRGGVTTK